MTETPPRTLYIGDTVSRCSVLGPGTRFVVWVTGCSLRCPGCIADPILEHGTGQLVTIDQLAIQILDSEGIDGVTFSGGEPFEQAGALADLCEVIRRKSDLSLMSYTGLSLEHLQKAGSEDQGRLLSHLDILVDGRFVKSLAGSFLWRGSSNQRIHILTERHREWGTRVEEPGAGVEVHIRSNGAVFWAGVPEPGFVEWFRSALAARAPARRTSSAPSRSRVTATRRPKGRSSA